MKFSIQGEYYDPFHAEERLEFKITSVAVWTFVLENDIPKYYVALEQADRINEETKGHPWEVPSGKVESTDKFATRTAVREVMEELGLSVNDENADELFIISSIARSNGLRFVNLVPRSLQYLNWYLKKQDRNVGSLLYYTSVDISYFQLTNLVTLEDGTLIFEPPAGVDRSEISRIALIPVELAFKRNILNENSIHQDATYRGLQSLRSLGLMNGSFPFEDRDF